MLIVSKVGKLVNEQKTPGLVTDAYLMGELVCIKTTEGLFCYHASTLAPMAQQSMKVLS